ncbi:MAG: hypothetical protein Q8M57_04850 [Nitrosomonas sp.]|uniref:hypothetical protein n=1 Tax=Nitrosomonas sp. TaxID=42353 RepID=UPI002732E2D1|nr:hypothetical protein [Nitrosomonas sp.]MDP3280365.1 hypothetical protein [Nitrosomonas sp.]
MSGSTKQISASQETDVTGDTLNRSMSVWHSFTLGFAVVSPVAGLYAIIGVQTVVAGGGWFAALAVCLLMQLLVATVYAELSSQFPIAGGAYKWARQLGGAIAGQYAGWAFIGFDAWLHHSYNGRHLFPILNRYQHKSRF